MKKAKSAAEKRLEAAMRLAELSAPIRLLEDPRMERCRKHELVDIVFLTLCAVISGAEGWIAVEEYGKEREGWLRSVLSLPHGIPSHDTIGRVFSALCPEGLQRCLQAMLAGLASSGEATEPGGVIAIDGKCLRRSMDKDKGQSPLYLLNAFATDTQTVLGQERVEQKSNEIKAMPALLEKLDIRGRTVTLDAMGCQKAVVSQVHAQGGDIVVALKDNHPSLHQCVVQRFEDARIGAQSARPVMVETGYRTHTVGPEKDHGRIETRTVEVLDARGDWLHRNHPGWGSIASVMCVTRVCEKKGVVTKETRHFISSHPPDDPAMLGAAVRAHWAIENNLHWTLDTAFREDDCRVRTDHAPENFSLLRKQALALLKTDTKAKVGIKNRRLKAAWNHHYLLKILCADV